MEPYLQDNVQGQNLNPVQHLVGEEEEEEPPQQGMKPSVEFSSLSEVKYYSSHICGAKGTSSVSPAQCTNAQCTFDHHKIQ